VTVEDFGQNLEERLYQLHHDLKTGRYEPQPVLRVEILKPDGSKHMLGIPTLPLTKRRSKPSKTG